MASHAFTLGTRADPKSQFAYTVTASLEWGEGTRLRIRQTGNAMSDGEGHSLTEIFLDNPHTLAQFIYALVARYNALVAETNQKTKDIHLESLRKITSAV